MTKADHKYNSISWPARLSGWSLYRAILTVVLLILLLGVCLPAGFYFLNRLPLFQFLQTEVKQAIKPASLEPEAISESSRQRVIIINPVSYDADLKGNREQSQQPLQGKTDLSGENSTFAAPDNDQHYYDEIKTSEIE